METPRIDGRIDLDKPRWEQSTFLGRLKHFTSITDTRLFPVSTSTLYEAKDLLDQYRLGGEPPGTTDEQIWYAKRLYSSAFHPDSGELQNVIGRMSFQATGGMLLTAGLLHFYRTNVGVITTQWLNQSFVALVNYTNRNAESALSTKQILVAYTTATTCALGTALGLKRFLATRGSPLVQRLVPLMAIAAANVINIPLTRQDEILNGVMLKDENGNSVTTSKYAAVKGISQVVFCRIFIASPSMLALPILMEKLEKKRWFRVNRWLHLPFQTIVSGLILAVTVPICCSIFQQRSSITLERLERVEPKQYAQVQTIYGTCHLPQSLYFNKGL